MFEHDTTSRKEWCMNSEIEGFLTLKRLKGASENTLAIYRFYLEKFFEFVKKPAKELDEQDLINFLAEFQKTHGPRSLYLVTNVLRQFYAYLKKRIEIPLPKIPKQLPKVLSREDVKKMIAAAKGKEKLLIVLLYSTGCRVSEILNLCYEDINLEEGYAIVKGGKGAKDRIVPLSKQAIELLKQNFGSGKIFNLTPRSVQRIVKRVAKRAGVGDWVTPHKLRHALATHLLESGVNIRIVQEVLGHASLNTTQIYTHVLAQEIKEISAKHPLDE